ncbi:hypothetical protein HC256_009430 [Beauveria bassiana]|nr:hypothetical protein HC256_009430 [Beauveria bassiana]
MSARMSGPMYFISWPCMRLLQISHCDHSLLAPLYNSTAVLTISAVFAEVAAIRVAAVCRTLSDSGKCYWKQVWPMCSTQLCVDAVDAVGLTQLDNVLHAARLRNLLSNYDFLLSGHSSLNRPERLLDGEHFIRARMCLPKKREVAALDRFVDLKEKELKVEYQFRWKSQRMPQ